MTTQTGLEAGLPFGQSLGHAPYGLPFAGLLLSIALCPLLAPHAWERHFGAITAAWTVAFVVPFGLSRGWGAAAHDVLHAMALDYIPFILLIFSLFVVAGGIRIAGDLVGDPKTNTILLAAGTCLASFLGTTGAAMLLIRPLIRANAARRHNTHVFVFFIFLVANIGGSLTPLGDPPLFLGFLRGIDFLWTTKAMGAPMALASLVLLAVFFAIDCVQWRKDKPQEHTPVPLRALDITGTHNVIYLAGIIAAVIGSAIWRPGIAVPIGLGLSIPLQDLARDAILLAISALSWWTTPATVRLENAFTWVPIREVAVLFLGIFITIIPVLALLGAGPGGPAGPMMAFLFQPDGRPLDAAFFWVTGLLSSVLDNAPTYLVFFNVASGDPATLMGPLHRTLLAISMGAVFMGANTYLGNAPNFMIKAICEEQNIRMPSFFGYMLWSGVVLLPLFAVLTLVFLV